MSEPGAVATGLLVRRVKNRVYDGRRVKSHAEYSVAVDGETVAHIISCDGRLWVAVEGHTDNKFGLVVSPMNLRKVRQLKAWAMEQWNG